MGEDRVDKKLHLDARGKLFDYAQRMRGAATEAENFLWRRIKNRQMGGLKFRRQHPLNKFIADFYCHEKKLVIELDGGVHDTEEQRRYDEQRTKKLNELNITVIRFRNEDVMNNIEYVFKEIIDQANRL